MTCKGVQYILIQVSIYGVNRMQLWYNTDIMADSTPTLSTVCNYQFSYTTFLLPKLLSLSCLEHLPPYMFLNQAPHLLTSDHNSTLWLRCDSRKEVGHSHPCHDRTVISPLILPFRYGLDSLYCHRTGLSPSSSPASTVCHDQGVFHSLFYQQSLSVGYWQAKIQAGGTLDSTPPYQPCGRYFLRRLTRRTLLVQRALAVTRLAATHSPPNQFDRGTCHASNGFILVAIVIYRDFLSLYTDHDL